MRKYLGNSRYPTYSVWLVSRLVEALLIQAIDLILVIRRSTNVLLNAKRRKNRRLEEETDIASHYNHTSKYTSSKSAID